MIEENNNYTPEEQNQPQWQNQPVPPYNPYAINFNPEEFQKKRSIRRLGLAIGLPAISLSVIGFMWAYVYFFVTIKGFKMSYYEAQEFLNNPAILQILQIVLSCLMFLIPFTIGAKCLRVKISDLVMFGRAKKGTFLPFLLMGMGFCSFANISMGYISSVFQSFGIEYEVNFAPNPEGFFGFLLSFIATAIVPALVEEFACRGIVLGLLKKYGEGFAIISSSIIFGVMHGNFEQIPFATMVGMILGYIYVKTGSIWCCVAVHCVNNAISVIFTYLPVALDANAQNILYVLYLVISMILAIVGVWLFSKNTDENYNLEKGDEAITNKQKYTWLFTSWTIIVFISLNLLESLTFFVL